MSCLEPTFLLLLCSWSCLPAGLTTSSRLCSHITFCNGSPQCCRGQGDLWNLSLCHYHSPPSHQGTLCALLSPAQLMAVIAGRIRPQPSPGAEQYCRASNSPQCLQENFHRIPSPLLRAKKGSCPTALPRDTASVLPPPPQICSQFE